MPHILLVEDNSILSENITTTLEMGGYQVDYVEDGRQALDFLTTTRSLPDIIVTELSTQKVDGFKLIVACYQRVEWKDIPFIFLCTFCDELRGKKLGTRGDYVHPSRTNELMIA